MGRDESNVSNLSMMRSLMIPDGTTAMKENEEHQNRDHLCGTMCNTEMLTKKCHRQEELKQIHEEETEHCKTVLSMKKHCKKQRHDDTVC